MISKCFYWTEIWYQGFILQNQKEWLSHFQFLPEQEKLRIVALYQPSLLKLKALQTFQMCLFEFQCIYKTNKHKESVEPIRSYWCLFINSTKMILLLS